MLAEQLRRSDLSRRDRGLVTQLVYGSIAWQGLSDHILESLGRPPDKLDPEIRTILRLALFQLTKLDRVPDFASVDTAVTLAKKQRGRGVGGLVNALLRKFLRADKDPQLPSRSDIAHALSVTYSHPRWIVDRWLQEFESSDVEALLVANNQAAPTALRVNTTRASHEEILTTLAEVDSRRTQYSPEALRCTPSGPFEKMEAFRQGLFTPQGEASHLVGAMVPIEAGDTILDACAAPGGKSTHLAERAKGAARIIALDRSKRGIVRVAREASRLGVAVEAARADATRLPFGPGVEFAAALVDAPCSGLGTLRQHPEIRWRRTPEDATNLANLQSRILDSVAGHIRPGGSIVYSTCTLLAEENQQRVSKFLREHSEFRVADPRAALPAPARDLVDPTTLFLQTYPHRHDMDGFFAARLQRAPTSQPS